MPIRGLIRTLREDRYSDSRIAVLRIRQQTNDQAIADFLDVSPGETVAQVTSILRIDKPICWLDCFFPVERVPWLLGAAVSLKGGEQPKIGELPRLTRIDVSFENSSCGPWTAKMLGVRTGDPALIGRLVQYGTPVGQSRERPVELTRSTGGVGEAALSSPLRRLERRARRGPGSRTPQTPLGRRA